MTDGEQTSRSGRFLILIPDLAVKSLVIHTALSVIRTIESRGYQAVPRFLPENGTDVKQLVEVARKVDEVLPLLDLDPADVERIEATGTTVHPAVFNSSSSLFPLTAAIFGAVGREMVQRMVRSGRRNLVYVSTPIKRLEPLNQLRYAGALQGCLLNGIPAPTQFKANSRSGDLSGELIKLFGKNPNIDGFMCHEDILAMEIIQALRLCGRMVPSDCAVIGVDNNPECSLFNPPITSVDVDATQVGQIYGEAVIDHLEGRKPKEIDPAQINQLLNLVVRVSG